MNFLKKISKEEWLIAGAIAMLTYLIFSKKSGKRGKTKAIGIQNADKYSKYGKDVVSVARAFEPLGTGGYRWKNSAGQPSTGLPLDIYFQGTEPIFKKPNDGSTYCTGYTFAVAFTVALNRGLLNGFTNKDIVKMQEVWNAGDPKKYPKLCVDAIAKPLSSSLQALGKEVTIDQAKAGDFCQIWRSTTSGHSVIVLEMIKKNNKIIGIKYYSSNSSKNPTTNRSGAGENTEYFSDAGGTMLLEKTYYARLND